MQDVSQGDIDVLVEKYYNKYDMILDGRDPEEFKKHVAVQAGIEIGFERFLEEKNYQAIVTHFGDLGSLKQLPGLAIQRLMEKGYGFGGEGDWKTAAMVRLMKIMSAGKKDAKGTSGRYCILDSEARSCNRSRSMDLFRWSTSHCIYL